MSKSRLSFELHFRSDEMSQVELPIEVRQANSALVARSLSTQSVEVDPGTYHVFARLPAGQELHSKVTVKRKGDTTVVLKPSSADESPNESLEVPFFLRGGQRQQPLESKLDATIVQEDSATVNADDDRLEPLGIGSPSNRIAHQINFSGISETESPTAVGLRAFRGNALLGQCQEIENLLWMVQQTFVSLPAGVQFTVNGASGVQIVQLLQPDQPALNLLLPVSADSTCTLILTRQSDGRYSIDAQLQHITAEALLRYREQGDLESAAAVAASNALAAEQLLYTKFQDPIAAAVGAYAMLRFGELEQLHDWTENLKNWFPWLADGAAIRGEHLTRLGEHPQALSSFLELSSRGLPIFSSGLSYAINRLRLYVEAGERYFERDLLDQAIVLLQQLQQFAAFVNFQKPILLFTGIDPNHPDDTSVSHEEIASRSPGIADMTWYLS